MTASNTARTIASVFQTPIHVHASWVVFLALVAWRPVVEPVAPYAFEAAPFSWIPSLLTCAFLFLSLLLHELGHVVMALRRGFTVRSITLFAFGGVTEMEKDPEDGRTELEIAAVGPLVSLLLAACFYAATFLPLDSDDRAIAGLMALVNLALAIFNMLPAFPLDGGRMLRGLMWSDRGAQRTTRIAFRAGEVLALVVIALGGLRVLADDLYGAAGCVLLASLLKDAAVAADARVRLHDTLRGLAVRDAMLTEMAAVPAHVPLSDLSPRDLLRGGLRACPVVRGRHVVGILAVDAVFALSPEEQSRTSVQGLMVPLSEGVLTDPGGPLLDAMARLTRVGAGPLLVVQDGDVHGILSIRSILQHRLVREVMTS